jgi:hypothetical protein
MASRQAPGLDFLVMDWNSVFKIFRRLRVHDVQEIKGNLAATIW